jgi:hypothetical protein
MNNLVKALRRYKEPVPHEAADRIEALEAALRAVENISLDNDHEAATMAITAVARKVLA